MKHLRLLLPLLLFLLPIAVKADIWAMGTTAGTQIKGTSQSGVCAAWAAAEPYESWGTNYTRSYEGVSGGNCMWNTPLHGVAQATSMSFYPGQDCPAPQVPNGSTGLCEAPKSPCEQVKDLINGTSSAYAYYSVPVGSGNATGSFCDSGCAVNLAVADTAYYTDGKNNSFSRQKMYTGQSCTNEPNAPTQFTPEKKPPTPPKPPPCSPLEGVMTSSSGTIACVPPGTPNSNTPIVKKETSTQTNPDGSKVTNETVTTRDPSTGVENKTTTSSGTSSNGTPTGTTTTNSTSGATNGGNPEKPGDSDFCQKNPNLDICTGKLNKEETQKKVADSLSAENFNASEHLPETINPSDGAKTKLDQAKDSAIADVQKFGTSNDPVAGKYTEFKEQMEGWLGEIPITGCTPFSAVIGPYRWNFDHCEKALKIAEIFGYCLWVMLAFGVFSLATRNRG